MSHPIPPCSTPMGATGAEQAAEQLLAVQQDFVQAMRLYECRSVYGRLNAMVGAVNVLGPALLLWWAWGLQWGWPAQPLVWLVAYVAADFVNGWVHLHMDHQCQYRSWMGPWLAQFHLHHATPRYRTRPAWRVYVAEAGHKAWLAVLLCVGGAALVWGGLGPAQVAVGCEALGSFALCSCFAEVSHYWAHNGKGALVQRLQRWRLVLPRQHHMRHHQFDNTHYAFLNGMSDGLLNAIARRWYSGYKRHSDTHYELYMAHKSNP